MQPTAPAEGEGNTKDNDPISESLERVFIDRDKLARKLANAQAEKPDATDELIDIAEDSQEELVSATTVFPFTLFPHTITLDRQKLSIIHRNFFRVANIISVKITDVLNVESHVGPVFGTVRIHSRYFGNNAHEIRYLKRDDAIKIHKILQGYMIANEKEIDCSQVPKEDLIVLLNELGHPAET